MKSAFCFKLTTALLLLCELASAGKVLVNRVIPSENLLKCWNCIESRNCIMMENLTDISKDHCGFNQPFCMVKSSYEKTEIRNITRGCVENCSAGCKSISILGLHECTSCCSHSLCNEMNALSPPLASNILVIVCMQIAEALIMLKY